MWECFSTFSIHQTVGLLLALFLLAQIWLSVRHGWAMREGRRQLAKLRDSGQFTAGSSVPRAANRRHNWVQWVADRVQEGSLNEGRFHRDDALKELDVWLESHSSYLLLQRTAIMAPLIGLLITVGSFFLLEPSQSETTNVADILYSLTPLVLGVGAGAVLAIVNQCLLHWAGLRCDAVRKIACDWFDTCVWKHVASPTSAGIGGVVESMARMAETMRSTAGEFRSAALEVTESSRGMVGVATSTRQTLEKLQVMLADFPDMFETLRSTSSEAVQGLTAIVPLAVDAVSGLQNSASCFQSAVQEDFGLAAQRCSTAATELANAAGQIHTTVGQLNSSSGTLEEAAQSQVEIYRDLSESLSEQLIPANVSFRSVVQHLDDSTGTLCQHLDRLNPMMDTLIERADTVGPKAEQTVVALSETASELRSVVCDQLGSVITQFQGMTASFADTSAQLGLGVSTLNERCQDLEKAAGAQTDAGALMKASIETALIPANDSLRQTVTSLQGTTDGLVQQVVRFSDTMDSSINTLASLIPTASQAALQFVPAVAAFQESVDNEFASAAAECRNVVSSIGQSSREIQSSVESLRAACDVFNESIRVHREATGNFSQSVSESIIPANSSLHEVTSQLQQGVSTLVRQIDSFRTEIGRGTENLDSVIKVLATFASQATESTAGLEPAVASLASLVETQLSPLVQTCQGGMNSLESAAEGLNDVVDEMTAQKNVLQGVVAEHHSSSEQIEPAYRSLQQTLQRFDDVSQQMSQSIDGQMTPLQQSLVSAAHTVQGSADSLAAFIRDGIDPATRRLVELEDTIGRLRELAVSLRTTRNATREPPPQAGRRPPQIREDPSASEDYVPHSSTVSPPRPPEVDHSHTPDLPATRPSIFTRFRNLLSGNGDGT